MIHGPSFAGLAILEFQVSGYDYNLFCVLFIYLIINSCFWFVLYLSIYVFISPSRYVHMFIIINKF